MDPTPKPTDFGRSRPPDEVWLDRALPEEVLDPDLPIIDAHVHHWHRPGWPYLVEDYARDHAAGGHNVTATVFVECGAMYRKAGPDHLRCVGETAFAADQAASGAGACGRVVAGIVGFADLRLDAARLDELLDAHIAAAGGRFRGVRMRAKWDEDPAVRGAASAQRPRLLLEPAFQRGLRRLSARGLCFEASVFHPQLPEVVGLAKAVPEAEIVLIHSGSPVGHARYAGQGTEVHAFWLRSMKDLAACPNVTVKLGGILMTLANVDFGTAPRPPASWELAELWRPYIEPCLEMFGAGRCMMASNFPVDRQGFGYRTVWNMFKRLTAGCPVADRRAVFSGTAGRIYRLPTP